MTALTTVVFALVYLGMFLGRLPGLGLDRPGIALVGAAILVAGGALTVEEAAAAADAPTLALLFAFMILSAQLRLAGLYEGVAAALADAPLRPPALLALTLGVVGLLSALFTNDVVCLALTPLLIALCRRRGLRPLPFLLGLACAANIGSAATLIGNPQNILIGQMLHLSFGAYLAVAAVPAILGLGVLFGILVLQARGQWEEPGTAPGSDPAALHRPQVVLGLLVTAVVVALYLATDLPRAGVALGAAGILLVSPGLDARKALAEVDYTLLILFLALFTVNGAFDRTGLASQAVAALAQRGIDLSAPATLYAVTPVLSNLVSNVPAVMLLLPVATHPLAGPILALSSTLAGNLLIVGSIANIIVVDLAARSGVAVSFRAHARTGIPVTLATLAVTALWLWALA